MNYTVNIDWKFIFALGASTIGIIFAKKMSSSDAKEVSIHVVDACKDYVTAFHA